jgi:hypothetical protein
MEHSRGLAAKLYLSFSWTTLWPVKNRFVPFRFCNGLINFLQCFIPSDLTAGRPTAAAFREKLPLILHAVPSADCAKGGHGAYSHSLDAAGLEHGVIRASEFRTYHTPMRKQTDFVEALRAAREFVDRASEKLKVREGKACVASLVWYPVGRQGLSKVLKRGSLPIKRFVSFA